MCTGASSDPFAPFVKPSTAEAKLSEIDTQYRKRPSLTACYSKRPNIAIRDTERDLVLEDMLQKET